MAARKVLIISSPEDVHAVAASRRLDAIGVESTILDFEDFPDGAAVTHQVTAGPKSDLVVGTQRIAAVDDLAVWFRRPGEHRLAAGLHHDYADYARRMTRLTLMSALSAAARLTVNRPDPNGLHYHKPFQIELARACGLAVPDTIVTNSPDEARAFVRARGEVVIKSPGSWKYRLLETRPIRLDSDFDFDLVRLCPVMLQEFVRGDREFRVTVIGDRCLSAEIDLSDCTFKSDSRIDKKAEFRPAQLPAPVEAALLSFHRAVGLHYGAYDLRCDSDGVPRFLEVNPDGQFLFIEIESGLPICDTLAAYLATASGAALPARS